MLLMGKSTISMAIFNCYVKLPEGNTSVYMTVYAPFFQVHRAFFLPIRLWSKEPFVADLHGPFLKSPWTMGRDPGRCGVKNQETCNG